MRRRDFLAIISATLAAGATYKEALGKAVMAMKAEPIKCTMEVSKPRFCGECEHFVENAPYSSGSYGKEEEVAHFCGLKLQYIGKGSPRKLRPCKDGLKLVPR